VPLPSGEPELAPADVDALFDVAEAAIIAGLGGGGPCLPDIATLPEALRRPVNAFVTLTVDGALNGCIGGIEANEPVGAAVAHHAWSAAFTDPRLPPLRAAEYERLVIEISLLSLLEPLAAASREEVLAQLRPHVDGLVVGLGSRRGLFLPAVWEQLTGPDEFLDHLLLKAGLAPRAWPVGMTASRFTATRYARACSPSAA
jgi:AmmeMemoRadiSam system protein A